MKTILLPTDFSENAWNAIKYALQLFKNDRCRFYVLNTYTPILYQTEYAMLNPGQMEMEDPIKENSIMNLETLKHRIELNFPNENHEFEFMAIFGSLISELRDTVRTKDIDLIIMGTKGATGAREILFGSNTVNAFNSVRAPILAVPDKFEFESPLEILFPTDYEVAFDDSYLRIFKEISSQYHSRINVMHVSYGETLTEEQKANRDSLQEYFKSEAPVFHDIKNQNIPQAIDDFQLRTRLNLLVMVNNKHSFFENLLFRPTVSRIGFHLTIPFLVIPSKN